MYFLEILKYDNESKFYNKMMQKKFNKKNAKN